MIILQIWWRISPQGVKETLAIFDIEKPEEKTFQIKEVELKDIATKYFEKSVDIENSKEKLEKADIVSSKTVSIIRNPQKEKVVEFFLKTSQVKN